MAALDFPANPTAGQVYEGDNGVIYTYVGTAPNGHWSAFAELSSESFADIFVEVKGDNMTGDLTLGTDKITLNAADGSITADGEVKVNNGRLSLVKASAGNLNSNTLIIYDTYTADGAVALFKADGSLFVGGTNLADAQNAAAPNISLKADGSADFNIPDGNGVRLGSRYEDKTIYIGIDSNDAAASSQSWANSAHIGFESGTEDSILYRANSYHKFLGGNARLDAVIDASSGNVLIGGTLPSAPNITLNADGSIIAAGGSFNVDEATGSLGIGVAAPSYGIHVVKQSAQIYLQSTAVSDTATVSFLSRDASNVGWKSEVKAVDDALTFTTDGNSGNSYVPTERARITKSGNLLIGGTLPTAPNISLNATSGDINTTGQVYSGLYDNTGLIRSSRTGDPNNLAFVVDGAATGDTRTFGVFGNGTVYVGGDFSGADPNIRLNPGGSAEYKGAATYYDFDLSATTNFGVSIQAGLVSVQRDSGNEDSAFIAYQGNTQTATITADGKATFKKELVVNKQGPSVPGVSLNNDGSIECGSDTSATSLAIKSAAVGGTNYAIISEAAGVTGFRVDSNGTITLADLTGSNTQLYPDGKSIFKSNMTVVLGKVGSPSDAALALQGSGGDFYATRYTNTDMCIVSSSSSGNNISWRASNNRTLMRLDDSGNLYTDGTVNGKSLLVNLEADDNTKYTTTIGDGGIEHRVYNGAVLDVKERIQKTDAALTALKSAAAAASDFAALKSAIATALADI